MAPIPDHPLVPVGEPRMIVDTHALAALIDELRSSGAFAYDTEFIGEMSYFPRLCLIQVATPRLLALIDPLAELELRSFWELVADPGVAKIVHAGMQDLEPVVRHLERPPANIFDTQIVAGFAGLGYPTGLAKLVQELLGVELGKGLTYTSWDHRPLSAVHQRYAADDVRYLPALKAAIGARHCDASQEAWAMAECQSLCDQRLYDADPHGALARFRGASGLSRPKQQILRALLELRDRVARQEDVPPRSLIKDDVLLRLARQPVAAVEQLAFAGGISRPVQQQWGKAIVETIAEAASLPATVPPLPVRVDETSVQRAAVDSLWSVVSSFCLGRGIDPAIVSSRQEVAAYYRAATAGESVIEGRLTQGWRNELLGPLLDDFLAGRAQVELNWTSQGLRAQTRSRVGERDG